jgi:hypothetical protein
MYMDDRYNEEVKVLEVPCGIALNFLFSFTPNITPMKRTVHPGEPFEGSGFRPSFKRVKI